MTDSTEPGELEPIALSAAPSRSRVRLLPVVAGLLLLGLIGAVAVIVWLNADRGAARERAAAAEQRARDAEAAVESELLVNEFRAVDLLVLPEVDGMRASLAIVTVANEREPRTWLLLRAGGARPGDEYVLTVTGCEPGAAFVPYTFTRPADEGGDLELTAQNMTVPTDDGNVMVRLHRATEPVLSIRGPLVRPDRIAVGPVDVGCSA